MKKLLIIIVLFSLSGCCVAPSYIKECTYNKYYLEELKYLACWDSMFIGYLSAAMPKEQYDELVKGFQKQIKEKHPNIWCVK